MELPFSPLNLSRGEAAQLVRGLIDGSLKNDSGERLGLLSSPSKSVSVRAVDSESPSGTGAGCGNVKGVFDSYGTMTVDGSFAATLSYLLNNGFLCDGHAGAYGGRYPIKAEIGIFTKVYEDTEGLQLEWEYHKDPASQAVRQKTQTRLDNGKFCGMSIGFYVGDGTNNPVGWTWTEKETEPDCDYIYIQPQDFERAIPEYSAPEYIQENLERAENFSWGVYILKHVHVYETSQTQIPANENSQIAEVRSRRNSTTTMTAEERAKKAEDAKRAKLDDCRDALDGMKRAHKNAKEAHEDHKEQMDGHLAKLAKGIKAMESHLDALDDDDAAEPEEKPKSGAGRAAFNGGK